MVPVERLVYYIVVQCDDYKMAQDACEIWFDYLTRIEPECIHSYNRASLTVEVYIGGSWDTLRYIFCDYPMTNVFKESADEILYVGEFFDSECAHCCFETLNVNLYFERTDSNYDTDT